MRLDASDYPNYGLDEGDEPEVTPDILKREREYWERVERDAERERLEFEAEKLQNAYTAESMKY